VTVPPVAAVPAVSIVVVTHNAAEWATRCLRTLLGEGAPAAPHEVVVVDNASTDGLREQLAELLPARTPNTTLVRLDENLGFGRACNLGVQRSRGAHVLLLNPDAIIEAGAADRLLDFCLRHPEHGIVGGRTLRPDGTLDPSSCWGEQTLWSLACAATGLSALFRRSPVFDPESLGRWQRDSVREVDVVTGCLLMASRTVWDALGGFDPDFFMYGEDADLCRRARLLGYRPAITPHAVAVHAVGASSALRADKLRLLFRGKATLIRKHWTGPRRRLGIGLLAAAVWARAAGEAAARRRPPVWRELWQAREEWVAGW
jgi:N-acetylglucosaminyl-diphospho-decaprenol L-rhamnosyltransferase